VSGVFTVSVIGTATNTVVATVDMKPHVVGRGVVAPDGKHAYFATSIPIAGGVGSPDRPANLNIMVLTTATETVAASSIDADQVGDVMGIAVSPNGKFVYFACAGVVVVLDTTLSKIVAKIPVAAAGQSKLKGMAIMPDGKHAYVTDDFDQVSVLDLTNNSVTSKVKLPSGANNLGGIAMSPDGGRAYVIGDTTTGIIFVIDTANNTMTGSIALPSFAPSVLAITPDGKTIYAGGGNNPNMYAVDVATSAVTDTITLAADSIATATIAA
jgi:YVTN family beta-propeller protein